MSTLLRAASPALIAALAAGTIEYRAELFTITLIDGTVRHWTNFDQALTYGADTYVAQGQLLTRSSWKVTNTMEVPSLALKLASLNEGDVTGFFDGAALQGQIHDGLFDGATVLLQEAFMGADINPNTLGALPLFLGKIAGLDLDGVTATLSIKGKVNDLDQYVPRNLYQPACNHAFCDAGCTLNPANFTGTFAAGAGATSTFIPWQAAPANASAYQNGTLVVTSGVAAGSRRTIAQAGPAGISVTYPLAFVPAAADTFTALQGCDKTLDSGTVQSCTARANTQHFRGFPWVPEPASAY